jgi:hypothetical protein
MSEGVGERMGVKMLTGQDRLNLLKSYDWDKDAEKNPVIKDTTAVKVDTTLVASATTK